MILYNPGNMSDQGSLSSMLRTIYDKDSFLNITINSHDPIQKKSTTQNDVLCKMTGSQDHFVIETEIDLKTNHNLLSALKMKIS